MERRREKIEEKEEKSAKLIKESLQAKLGGWEDHRGRCHHTHTHTFLFFSPLPSLAFDKTEVLDWASPAPWKITKRARERECKKESEGFVWLLKRVLLALGLVSAH